MSSHRDPAQAAAPPADPSYDPSPADGSDALAPRQGGRYAVRLAATAADVEEAQRLRWLCFIGNRRAEPGGEGTAAQGLDIDDLDPVCRHVLIEEQVSGTLVACFRFMPIDTGAEIERSYSARYYNLDALAEFRGRMVEMGRFCIRPGWGDPSILRLAWGAMTAHVDAEGVEMLFGCSSFYGTDPDRHVDAFAMLKDRHLAPKRWLPRVKAPDVFRFAKRLAAMRPDPRRAQAAMPPLLRSYLAMGGWVSDHAVVDPQLRTMHVFTGLEIAAIPPARRRLLRALAG